MTRTEFRQGRKRLRLTQAQLATRMGVGTRTIHSWETKELPKVAGYAMKLFLQEREMTCKFEWELVE